MKMDNRQYATETYFPKGVYFEDAKEPVDCKDDLFTIYTETLEVGQKRGLSIVEMMNERVKSESNWDTKRVCYILISHGMWVDETALIMELLERDHALTTKYLQNINDYLRKKLLK